MRLLGALPEAVSTRRSFTAKLQRRTCGSGAQLARAWIASSASPTLIDGLDVPTGRSCPPELDTRTARNRFDSIDG
jgi:hypothetical protein